MKTIVIAAPDMLPPEMANDPSVLVLDPASLDEELMSMLEAASGGMLGEDEDEDESGEGSLADWAAEEEQEHAHAKGGYGDEEDEEARSMSGEGDDEDEESGEGDDAMDDPETKFGKMGRSGRAGDEDEKDEDSSAGAEENIDESKAPFGKGRFGKGAVRGGKGLPPLAAWARSMGGMGRR